MSKFLKEIFPKLFDANGDAGVGKELDGLTTAQLAFDILGPSAYGLFTAPATKRAKAESQVNLTVPELMTGVVRDMARPNMAMPTRTPKGSSMAEENMVQLFRDAFQRTREGEYETRNEMSKIGQEQQITDRYNRNVMAQAGIKNQEALTNAGISAREYFMRLADQQSTMESLYGNVSQDLGQLAYLKGAERISKAAEIVRNPTAYGGTESEDYKRALAIMRSGLAGKGRKLKTKFSTRWQG